MATYDDDYDEHRRRLTHVVRLATAALVGERRSPSSLEGSTMTRESTSAATVAAAPINHDVADPVAPRLRGGIVAVTPHVAPRLHETPLSSGGGEEGVVEGNDT